MIVQHLSADEALDDPFWGPILNPQGASKEQLVIGFMPQLEKSQTPSPERPENVVSISPASKKTGK